MVATDLSYRVPTSNVIYKVIKYDLDMVEPTVFPKHVKLPSNEDDCRGI